jgi:two-component system LytT family sensor kinase
VFEHIDINEPLLVNTIGHSVGLLLFAVVLILLIRNRRKGQGTQSYLPAITAALALLWNAGSLIVLAASSGLFAGSDVIAALSFAMLNILPAVLLQLSLEGEARPIWITGYALSAIAVALHLAELVRPDPRFHQAALWVIIAGFASLSVIAMLVAKTPSHAGNLHPNRRIPVSMCLLLFAISFVHFSPGHVRYAWSSEIALHHAGIPLALYVLLQDYRFLLLDTFLRFLTNGFVACGFILLSLALNAKFHILQRAADNPFLQGILIVVACLAVVALVFVRGRLQLLLTRVVFRRRDREPSIRSIREAGSNAESELIFLNTAATIVAAFVGASRTQVEHLKVWPDGARAEATLIRESERELPLLTVTESWVQVFVPMRFTKGDAAVVLLGRREGGRRYLSEDLRELERFGAVIAEQIERFRSSEIHRLVTQAELRALQSQINPHFLFNALNTLYGTIPRDAAEARRLVLNLAEIFRYLLQSDKTFIPLSEELQIVKAYLQIETLRLGDRLKTEITVDKSAEAAMIPILSIQPLIENAVKHGVAARPGPGVVRLSARTIGTDVHIEVYDDGMGFQSGEDKTSGGGGVGLDNVRQRLKLCFGESASLVIESTQHGSKVSFRIPANRPSQRVPQEVLA